MMDDQDLSGDDLKTVRYRVLFTKRDLEAELDRGEQVINYPTSGGSLGALKISEFNEKLKAKKVKRPSTGNPRTTHLPTRPKGLGHSHRRPQVHRLSVRGHQARRAKTHEYHRLLVKAANKIATNVQKLKE